MNMIKTIKINKMLVLICFLLIVYVVLASIDYSKKTSADSYKTPFILIDAGHGGVDGGCVGNKTNVKESDLNLEYAFSLKKCFESMNYKVELIRSTQLALCQDKSEDMQKRKEIIEKSNCDIFISIHMNKFSLQSSKGAQIFYKMEDDKSKNLAESVKDLLVKNVKNARKLALSGDFLVLNSAKCPAILIECGFLSNPEEEINLQKVEYRENLCYQIFCGVMKYLNKDCLETD